MWIILRRLMNKYGHNKGDEILRDIADIIKKSLRKYDIAARWGGEEFALILPSTSKKNAFKIVERLRKKIESNHSLKKYNVTISLGVTSYAKRDNQIRITKRADTALYKAKASGKNCTIAI